MTTIEPTGAEDVAWNLSDLYASGDDPRIESDFAAAETATAAFRDRYYGKVAALLPAELAAAIDERERIEAIATRALYFAHLEFSTDMADTARGALVSRLGEKAAGLETQLLFFGLEWAAIEDEPAAATLADPALDHWRHWLAAQRVFRPYVLTEPEEKILTEKSVSGVTAWSRLYEEVLGAMRIDLPDADEPVSLETAMAKLYATDRDVRRGAAEAVTAALQPGLRTRTSIFNTILVDKWIDDRLRGYPTWITSRNLSNESTDEAVQALIDAATSRYDVPQRYYRLKAKLLGLDGLEYYDRFAPVAEDASKTPWAVAREVVVGAYADFSGEAGDAVERFFDEGWIDAPVRPDKRHGAFCATNVPGVHPYVFMNYTGDRRSILTLAHEMGHALHGSMAQPLGYFNASTPLTTAETASVFGEALTFKRLLAAEDDPRKRLDLLTGQLEDAIATTFRQIAMNRFENATHTERREQGELSADRINEIWIECQTALFGDSVGVGGYESWWS
uniref:M3 family oligoendopeptidase n=1 Tax=Gaiella sp. TaxID=2663207 RepID=UPI003983960F